MKQKDEGINPTPEENQTTKHEVIHSTIPTE